jgi:mono/diheme cytochrome c family protein
MKLYQQLANDLFALIHDGALRPADRVPSVRETARRARAGHPDPGCPRAIIAMRVLLTQRAVAPLLWVVGLGLGGFIVYAWRSAIPPVDPPAAVSFDADSLRRGAQLAALGNCITCHTAPGGESFAGGRPVPTPFGPIYSTNITPDLNTGIGHWSLAAFERAMREGVDREGAHLYPAFPYDHFTLMSDADTAALYAFIMTRQPVQAHTPENHLPFPFNIRLILAGWKLLFLHEGRYRDDPTKDEEWNRGAYLANGIAHCGACHTPRNSFGAEIGSQHFAGGEVEGWYAYSLNASSQSYESWNTDALHAYLQKGWHAQHGDAHGAMAPVTQALGTVADSDIRAIAVYVGSLMSREEQERQRAADTNPPPSNDTGAAIYATSCSSCHDGTRPLPFGGVKLVLSTAVTGENATNLIRVVLDGLHPPEGTPGAIMPGFSSTLTDGQLEALVAYLRSNIAAKPPWLGVESMVREARSRESD